MNKTLDLTKPVQTRTGQEVRIFLTDGATPYPVLGAIKEENGWTSQSWTKAGSYYQDDESSTDDLVNVPVTHNESFWVYLYKDLPPVLTRMTSSVAAKTAIAIKKIEFTITEGEGL